MPKSPTPQPPTGTSSLTQRVDQLYEFEREPVSKQNLESPKHFAAVFAGEHVAGTEFIIGAAFVAWGASASDILWGLLIGNALAVLSWTFICAPIATGTRLTLYWYLRKIAGPGVTSLYNVLNAVLFCVLSGTMITVSASAVRIPFGIPSQTKWYPEDFRFVLVVLVVGAMVVTIAILGFRRLAQFSEICVPWIFVMFIGGAVGMLPTLAQAVPEVGTISSAADLWKIAEQKIWLHNPDSGLGFWHIAAFAWICNLAFHVGLSDMALLRYAPRASYGLLSACGMYLGHYLAWICAGVMGAAAATLLKLSLSEIDAGDVAFQALGVSGVLAVIIAGWATSNPTLYRAGLALQTVTPGWPRWVVTLLAGVGTTIVACFPFVFTKLLEFVALFGILLSPVGAIVFVEHWMFERIGLQRYWFSGTGKSFSWPAMATWVITVAIAIGLWTSGRLHLFFIAIPLWFISAILYTVFCSLAGARSARIEPEAPAAAATVSVTSSVPRPKPVWLWVVGAVGLASLLVALVLPFWVLLAGADDYQDRLACYQAWLGGVSVLHLACVACWVIGGERKADSEVP